jgi:hypothetical protein
MDYSTGFYGGSVLINIANITMTASLLILIASLFLKVEDIDLNEDAHSPLWYIPSAIMAVSILLLTLDIFDYVASRANGGSVALSSDRSAIAALITGVLAISAVAFFAVSCLSTNIKSSLRGYLGMGAALFFGMYASLLFFRVGGAIHQPQKIATEMAAITASIFLLEETRVALGKERWKGYFALGAATVLISAYAVIPVFATYIIKGRMIAYSWGEAAVLLSVLIFAACRTASAVMCAITDTDRAPVAEEAVDISAEDERQIPNEEDFGN